MVDVYLKTGNVKSAYARLKVLGINIKCDAQGNLLIRPEEACEHCMTPVYADGTWSGTPPNDVFTSNGDYYFSIRMSEAQAAKLPTNDTPNFTKLTSATYPARAPRIA